METYIREQIGYCIGKINEYANTMGDEPTSMWYYWNGQLAALKQVLREVKNDKGGGTGTLPLIPYPGNRTASCRLP